MHFFLASTLVVLTLTINAGVVGRAVPRDGVGIAARSKDYDDVEYPTSLLSNEDLYRRLDVVEPEPVAPKPVAPEPVPGTPDPQGNPQTPGTGPGQNPGVQQGPQNPQTPGQGPGQNTGQPGSGPGQNPGVQQGPQNNQNQAPGKGPGQGDPGQSTPNQQVEIGHGPGQGSPDPPKPDPPKPDPKKPNPPADDNDDETPICKRAGSDCEEVEDSGTRALKHQDRTEHDVNYDDRFTASYEYKPSPPIDIEDRFLNRFEKDTGNEGQLDFKHGTWEQVQVWSKDGKAVTTDTYFEPRQNAMFGFQRFSEHDLTPKAEKVPSVELQFQKMKELKGNDIGDLKWVGDVSITNGDTRATLLKLNTGKKSKNKWTRYTPEDDPEAWKELAGTPNARGYFYMLGDHHEELNGLKVQEIYALWGPKAYLIMRLGR
ncbi:hypothetical protein MMC29_006168 [Sticta canariensis]|nr:hypothetical protein [Sticta canariensis]